MKEISIKNLADLLDRIRKDTAAWTKVGFARPWFRGQSNKSKPPLPSIFREGNDTHEFHLSTNFRLVAPGFGDTPETGRIDQWLFLMQHVGLPTRLLDWTESPLAAAFFATEKAAKREIENDAAIWAIDPIELNKLSGINYFPNTWKRSPVRQTIQIAWGTQDESTFLQSGEKVLYKPCEFPIALYPSSVHPRISRQKSCFTLHGTDKRDFEILLNKQKITIDSKFLKYVLPTNIIEDVWIELNQLGITYSTIFPDLDGLAKELKVKFGIKLS